MLTARESALEIVQLFANCRGWLVAMGFNDSFGGGGAGLGRVASIAGSAQVNK